MPSKILKFLLAILIGILSGAALATTYYRLDTRAPADIHRDGGFRAQGQDTHVLNHALNEHVAAPPRDASAYVAFTREQAVRTMAGYFYDNGQREMWLYSVDVQGALPRVADLLAQSFAQQTLGFRAIFDPSFPTLTPQQFEDDVSLYFERYERDDSAMDFLLQMSSTTGAHATAIEQDEFVQQDLFPYAAIRHAQRVTLLNGSGDYAVSESLILNPSGSEPTPPPPLPGAVGYWADQDQLTAQQIATLLGAGADVSFCGSSTSRTVGSAARCPAYLSRVGIPGTFDPTIRFKNPSSVTGMGFGAEVRQWVSFSGIHGALKSDHCGLQYDSQFSKYQAICFSADASGHYIPANQFTSNIQDFGWSDGGQAFVDVNGDGKADYCRLVYLYTQIRCDLSTGRGLAGTVYSGYIDGGYRYMRWWADVNGDHIMDFCRVTSSGMVCSLGSKDATKIFKQTVVFSDNDCGWSDSRAFVDNEGRGRDSYCRLVYVYTHLRCNAPDGKGGFTRVESGYIDGGYPGYRYWARYGGYPGPAFCRAVGASTRQTMKCLRYDRATKTFKDSAPFALPAPPADGGLNVFADLLGRRIDDVCVLNASKGIYCALYKGGDRFGARSTPEFVFARGFGNFADAQQVVLPKGPGDVARYCRNVGFGTLSCIQIDAGP